MSVCACVRACVCVCVRVRESERERSLLISRKQDFTKWLCCTKSNAAVTKTCTDTVVAVTFLTIVTTHTCHSSSKVLVLVMRARVYERACYCAL